MSGRNVKGKFSATTPMANVADHPVDDPRFAQPVPTADPGSFRIPHASDAAAYKELDSLQRLHELKPLPFPSVKGAVEPILLLKDVYGKDGAATVQAIEDAGQIVFHAVGDTGNTRSVNPQNLVADKLVSDFHEADPKNVPKFFFHLGDVIYSFGEAKYYYDQFYEPYRDYPAPIVAIPGNHDGMIAPGSTSKVLQAFLDNFCAPRFEQTPEAGGLDRTAMIQPGVYFTLEAPFVRILGLYSNALEDPGVISSQGGTVKEVTDVQLDFLRAALKRVKKEQFQGALIIAVHHPPFTTASKHSGSPLMLKDLDSVSHETGVWPHAVLSGHAHNYQRYTRALNNMEIPYLISGNGGHNHTPLTRKQDPVLRVPLQLPRHQRANDKVTLENYDDQDYGYMRILVNAKQLRIEYHPATDGAAAKTPDDAVTIDLKSRKIVHFQVAAGA
jgi:hypothetical protein